MPVEARSRLDGQGGFRGGMKGRRIKGTRYGERRVRGTWVANPGPPLNDTNLTQGSNIAVLAARLDCRRRLVSYVA